jgi:S-adenosylmethionine hydrolase
MGKIKGSSRPNEGPPPIITLTTDFGTSSPYVGAMKGVLLTINPRVRLVDIAHHIPPQDIRRAALVLADATGYFPPNAIHIAVIDPGVGTQRRIIYAQIGQQQYIAPDNGVLDRLAARQSPSKIIAVTDPQYWLPHVSATFHGRDIMAPVAARLSLGLRPDMLGPAQQQLVPLQWPEVRILADRIEGEIVAVDTFGNLITNITREMLAGVPVDDSVTISCDEHETVGIFTTYADQPEMTLIALVGSSGQLELAIVNDSAAVMLGVGEGTKVTVCW